ncbi:MAG: phosphoglucomutase/phosphomannomutase PgmG [Alphaproteobacteria bacterium]
MSATALNQSHHFHPSVLREYDIRGIVGKTLSATDAHILGKAFASRLINISGEANPTICVGFDGRLSSPELSNALIEGVASTGANVINIGLGPTPMLYFAVKYLQAAAGIMVTGSHNPPDYNGFKMAMKSGPVYGDAIQEIGTIAASGHFRGGVIGKITKQDIREAYTARLLEDYNGEKALTAIWDVGNGATGEIMQQLALRLPGEHHVLFGDIDGNFPNHHPDPTVPENLKDLIAAVKAHDADIGIGFDGDGDRIGAVDGEGNIVWGDQLLALYAEEVLKNNPGATIIADVKASQTLFDRVGQLGGKPLMWKTGHSLIKAKMAETNSPLAGEMSGHIFFADKYYGYDDALYCAIRLLSLVANSGKSLKEMAAILPKVYNTPEIRFQSSETRKFAVIKEIKERLLAGNKAGWSVNDIDGVRVNTPEGWWLLRASNTQDVLVARAESASEQGLSLLKNIIAEQLALSDVALPKDFN